MTNSTQILNRLTNEKSPYLLQHAHNPVAWWPWCDEAFAKAKAEDKPIFLSIGYSTCHWCHVMARESFADEEVAAVLNRDFIAIKVDREERPAVDAVYMAACQGLTGSGGWPLTIIMTPEQAPFFAATYLPKHSGRGRVGLIDLLTTVAERWRGDRGELLASAEKVVAYLQETATSKKEPAEPASALLTEAYRQYQGSFDRENGGFGGAPKFPMPHQLLFLLRYGQLKGEEKAIDMAAKTLEHLYRGGIFDHIGGGFSRYATDARWLAPHFEKMLYDNALLAYVYLEAYTMMTRPYYRRAAEQTLDYVLRELGDPAGGFYSSQDADSEGREGKYYLLTPAEVEHVLGADEGFDCCRHFDITAAGNFEGGSIPNRLMSREIDIDAMRSSWRQALYDYRLARTSLHRDNKVLTAWNGLQIAALAKGYRHLGKERYLAAAEEAAAFIERRLSHGDKLYLCWYEGEANLDGHLDDYAFYCWALLELYSSTFKAHYLSRAVALAETMCRDFFDPQNGGFYLYAKDSERLVSRPKDLFDGALPSGNSVAALVLFRLARLTGEIHWQQRSDLHNRYLAGNLADQPAAHSFALLALMEALFDSRELIVCGEEADTLAAFQRWLFERDRFNLHVLHKTATNGDELAMAAPLITDYPLPDDGLTWYLCQQQQCAPPVHELSALREMLD